MSAMSSFLTPYQPSGRLWPKSSQPSKNKSAVYPQSLTQSSLDPSTGKTKANAVTGSKMTSSSRSTTPGGDDRSSASSVTSLDLNYVFPPPPPAPMPANTMTVPTPLRPRGFVARFTSRFETIATRMNQSDGMNTAAKAEFVYEMETLVTDFHEAEAAMEEEYKKIWDAKNSYYAQLVRTREQLAKKVVENVGMKTQLAKKVVENVGMKTQLDEMQIILDHAKIDVKNLQQDRKEAAQITSNLCSRIVSNDRQLQEKYDRWSHSCSESSEQRHTNPSVNPFSSPGMGSSPFDMNYFSSAAGLANAQPHHKSHTDLLCGNSSGSGSTSPPSTMKRTFICKPNFSNRATGITGEKLGGYTGSMMQKLSSDVRSMRKFCADPSSVKNNAKAPSHLLKHYISSRKLNARILEYNAMDYEKIFVPSEYGGSEASGSSPYLINLDALVPDPCSHGTRYNPGYSPYDDPVPEIREKLDKILHLVEGWCRLYTDEPNETNDRFIAAKKPELWNYMLSCTYPQDHTSAETLTKTLLGSSATRFWFMMRMAISYLFKDVLALNNFRGFLTEVTRKLIEFESQMQKRGLAPNERQALIDERDRAVESILKHEDWKAWRSEKLNFHTQRLRDMLGCTLNVKADRRNAGTDLGVIVIDTLEVCAMMHTSQLTFLIAFPETGVKFNSGAMIARDHEGVDPIQLQVGMARVKLVITPMITLRDDRETTIKAKSLQLASVLINN